MKTVEICVHGLRIKRQCPETFTEVNGRQFLAFAEHLAGITSIDGLFSQFFEIPQWLLRHVGRYSLFVLEQRIEFLCSMSSPIDRFLIVSIPHTSLIAPAARLAGISFMQFMYADKLHADYLITKNEDTLCRFVASLYRRRKVAFKDVDMAQNIRTVKRHSSPALLFAVSVNYILIKNYLSQVYPFMFPSSAGGGTQVSTSKRPNWMDVFDAFVGDNIPATEYYRDMPCMDAFRIINRRIKDYQKHAGGRNRS
jgi:hypothetical protein